MVQDKQDERMRLLARFEREFGSAARSIDGSFDGLDAIGALHKSLFKGRYDEADGTVWKDFWAKSGVLIGGFLYLNHSDNRVDYKFFGGEESESDYMIPYVWSEDRVEGGVCSADGARVKRKLVDRLFYQYRGIQQKYVWEVENDKNYLVPEYASKVPIFLGGSNNVGVPWLYVSSQDMLSSLYSYCLFLENVAGFTRWVSHRNFWETLRGSVNRLTKFEERLIGGWFDAEDPYVDEVDTLSFDGLKERPSLVIQKIARKNDIKLCNYDFSTLEDFYENVSFPVLPYLYWHLIEEEVPKCHLVLPVWTEFSARSEKCLKWIAPDSSDSDSRGKYVECETRCVALAVVTVDGRMYPSADSCMLPYYVVSKIASQQVSAAYYSDLLAKGRLAKVAALAVQSLSHNLGSHFIANPELINGVGRRFEDLVDTALREWADLHSDGIVDSLVSALFDSDHPDFRRKVEGGECVKDVVRRVLAEEKSNLIKQVNAFLKEGFSSLKGEISELFDPGWSELRDLLMYLQVRFDYVSRVSSGDRPALVPLHFFKGVLLPFLQQKMLLLYLLSDQHYSIGNSEGDGDITFKIRKLKGFELGREGEWQRDGGETVELSSREIETAGGMQNSDEDDGGSELGLIPKLEKLDDFFVAVPGGALGAHALYGVFENLLRNSVKYSRRKLKTLEVFVDVAELEEGGCRIYIHDNLSSLEKQDGRSEKIAKRLLEEKLDGLGDLGSLGKARRAYLNVVEGRETTGHGMTEIREALAFLKGDKGVGGGLFLYAGSKALDVKNATEWNGAYCEGAPVSLVCEVSFQPVRLLGVWKSSDCLAESTQHIKYSNELADLLEWSPYLTVLRVCSVDDWDAVEGILVERRYSLPFRLIVFVDDSELKARLESRLSARGLSLAVKLLCSKEAVELVDQWQKQKSEFELVVDVYDFWMLAYKPLLEGKRWHIDVSLERKHIPKAWKDRGSDASLRSAVWRMRCVSEGEPTDTVKSKDYELDPSSDRKVCFSNHVGESSDGFNLTYGKKQGLRMFQFLFAPPHEKTLFRFYVLQLLESALTRIVIYDERFAELFEEKDAESRRKSWFSLAVCKDSSAARLYLLAALENGEPIYNEMQAGEKGISWDQKCRYGFPVARRGGAHVPPGGNNGGSESLGDVLVLHEGLIEVLELNEGGAGSMLESLFGDFRRIVRMSGKGAGKRALDERLPYCESSAVSSCVRNYLGADQVRLGIDKHELFFSITK